MKLDKKFNPLENSSSLTSDQINSILDLSTDIFENLDEYAVGQLFQGAAQDLDMVFDSILKETSEVLFGDVQNVDVQSMSHNYVDTLGEQFEETLRCYNFNYFAVSVLESFDINWHHLEWGNFIQLYMRLAVLAPRDHSKSHWFSLAYPLWKMYRYKPKLHGAKKELYLSKSGMIITNEHSLAKKLLRKIREEVDNNPVLAAKLKPDGREGWGKEELFCKNGAHLETRSFGQTLRGPHPGYIIVDDFLDKSAMYSSSARDKFDEVFFAEIMNMIVPDGQVVVVGTPFHTSDLYGTLKKKTDQWRVFEYPAIFPDGSLLWKDRYNLQALLNKRKDQGPIIFSREILVRPVSDTSTIFPYSLIEKSFIRMEDYTLVNNIQSHSKKFTKIVVGCDFARSANVGADYSVFMVMGVDDLDNYWLLHVWREKGKSYNEQIASLKSINANFRPDIIMIEVNQMQQLFADGGRNAGLPIVEHTTGTNKKDLEKGLPGLAILFEQQRIRMPRGDQYSLDVTDKIAEEFMSISWTDKGKLEGVGEHDDLPMAMWITLLAANYVNRSFNFGFI